ncbi:hypothetical protein PM082_014922 [Marasmius tenuissimus]|nr:hypothetical protein PM082_014922 [Marasmius tenuissimus]
MIAISCNRRRSRNKLDEAHEAPHPSILPSTLTNPSHYPAYSAADPPTGILRSPESSTTTLRPDSHAPLGFDEMTQKRYHSPSAGSSPSLYSVSLSHEPAPQAHRFPGSSNV